LFNFKTTIYTHASPAMSASRQLMKWSPQVHQDILIATFCNLSLSSEQWAKVMADLSKMGYTFSENALRYVDIFGPMAFHQWQFTHGNEACIYRPVLNTPGSCASLCHGECIAEKKDRQNCSPICCAAFTLI
jgi:hypothetical protein